MAIHHYEARLALNQTPQQIGIIAGEIAGFGASDVMYLRGDSFMTFNLDSDAVDVNNALSDIRGIAGIDCVVERSDALEESDGPDGDQLFLVPEFGDEGC
jgi:hypothetical protein